MLSNRVVQAGIMLKRKECWTRSQAPVIDLQAFFKSDLSFLQ